MAYLAQSLVNLRNEVNAKWPNRSKASDGWIGDASHAARVSDHNPDGKGCVHAIDITASGVDTALIIEALKRHPSVNYFIHKGLIWERSRGFSPRNYTGDNPHTTHIHISILRTSAAENNATKWLGAAAPPVAAKPAATFWVRVDKAKAMVRVAPNSSAALGGSRELHRGAKFEATGTVTGEKVSGNNVWYKSKVGNYVWSGGLTRI